MVDLFWNWRVLCVQGWGETLDFSVELSENLRRLKRFNSTVVVFLISFLHPAHSLFEPAIDILIISQENSL